MPDVIDLAAYRTVRAILAEAAAHEHAARVAAFRGKPCQAERLRAEAEELRRGAEIMGKK